ncbi:MAG: hypothetical protein AABZ08_01645 [Planctomycetota bacterium]
MTNDYLPTSESPEQPPKDVISIPVTAFRSHSLFHAFVLLVGGLALAGLLLVFLEFKVPPNLTWPLSLALVVAGCIPFVRAKRRGEFAHIRSVVRQSSQGGLQTAIVEAVSGSYSVSFESAILQVVNELSAQGRAGLVIQFHAPSPLPEVKPLVTPFEPCPLGVNSAVTAELEHTGTESALFNGNHYTSPAATLATRHSIPMQLFAITVKFAPLLFLFVIQPVNRVISTGIVSRGDLFTIVIVPLLVGVFVFRPSRKQIQYFAVPGGVLVRTAGWWDEKAKLRVLTRSSCVLGIVVEQDSLTYVIIADTVSEEQLLLNSSEVTVLLRAWLSPIPPPDVKKLVDFQ